MALTGFNVQGYCYPDPDSALIGFQGLYPVNQGSNVYSLSSSSIDGSGLITYSVQNQSAVAQFTNVTLQLSSCDPASIYGFGGQQITFVKAFAIPLAADLQTAFLLSFGLVMICYLTSWAYGSVINWFNERQH